jgi:PST family polysaccharide transporter
MLIGWYLGAGPLGLYSRAYNLLMLPLRQLNTPLAAVAMPTFSRTQDEPERYARYYLRTANLMMWMIGPLVAVLFVAAQPVVILLLGNQWRDSAAVFQILGISALAQPLFESTNWLFVSRGATDRLLKLGLITFPIIIGSFVVGLQFGIKGVALSYSLTLVAILPWVFHYSFHGTNLTLQRLTKALLHPVSICMTAVLFAEFALRRIAVAGNVLSFLVTCLAVGAVYSFSAILPSVRQELLSFRNMLLQLRPSTQTD